MGKYKGFKNRLERFFSSEEGQRVFNFAYSFGAAIVIVGALFKLLHLPFADVMLCIGMGSEALIFALSAFDKPAKNYHWEEVFPVLETGDKADRPNLSGMVGNAQAKAPSSYNDDYSHIPSQGVNHAPVNNIELSQATEQYARQLIEMTQQLEQLKNVTSSLSQVQASLLNSYSGAGGSFNLNSHSESYAQQMEALTRNISGLNAAYEMQLKSVSNQLETLDRVNSGLSNVRNMYDSSAMDGFKIRQETEKMTENLANLNKVYERMLNAMTAGMQGGNTFR